MSFTRKKKAFTIALLISMVLFSSCAPARRPGPGKEPVSPKKPAIPKVLNAAPNKEPRLKVYIKDEGVTREIPFEEYVAGVVGGEIKNDWPEETIKAQAIVARSFVLHFIQEKGKSKYGNAHVSTDIEEAQAWNPKAVNDRIKKAVADTRGQVLVYEGKYANTWFHSNAGGKTATASEGLNYKGKNPPYIRVVKSPDDFSEVPADERKWTISFTKEKVINAVKGMGKNVQNFSRVSIGKKGPSGRATTISFDNTQVSAPELRLALGSTEMKSTLLDKVSLEGDKVVFTGRGYGHGVGMSQWGAYHMAESGKKASDIINYYFKGVNIVKMW